MVIHPLWLTSSPWIILVLIKLIFVVHFCFEVHFWQQDFSNRAPTSPFIMARKLLRFIFLAWNVFSSLDSSTWSCYHSLPQVISNNKKYLIISTMQTILQNFIFSKAFNLKWSMVGVSSFPSLLSSSILIVVTSFSTLT